MSNEFRKELALNDSVIIRTEISGAEISLVFSVAHIHFFNEKNEWLPNMSEFKKARLTIENVTGRVPCEGTILDGHFTILGERHMNIPLPGPHQGGMELHLVMDCGEFTFQFEHMRIVLLSKT